MKPGRGAARPARRRRWVSRASPSKRSTISRSSYLREFARQRRYLADSAVNSPTLVSNGLLTESCDALNATCDDNQKQFKGIFMRFLGQLNDDGAVGGAYSGFIQTQTDSLWNADRDSLNRLGERWSGQGSGSDPNVTDWRTQASGLEGLDAGT